MPTESSPTPRLDAATLLITVAVLGLLIFDMTDQLDERHQLTVQILDTIACAYFLAEFSYRFRRAQDRATFLRRYWIDLVASIPLLPGYGQHLRWGRLVRLARAARILRGARIVILLSRSTNRLWDRYREFPLRTSLVITGAATLTGATVVFIAEIETPGGGGDGITSFGQALWWAIATVSTVGYGDTTPTSILGRSAAVALIIIGVALFGSCSAILAAHLVRHHDDPTDAAHHADIVQRLDRIEQHLGNSSPESRTGQPPPGP